MFSLINKWFKRNGKSDETAKSKKAIMFVDFEYWYYSYRENFDMKPEPKTIFTAVRDKYELEDILVFGDFTRTELKEYLENFVSADVTVINSGETFFQRKKSVTDFVILDRMYRAAARKDIGTYVLLSGDGHFRFVVEYLRELEKEVVVYGVVGSFSRALQTAATAIESLPVEEERYRAYYRMIAEQMAYLCEQTGIIPTFLRTAEKVARYNNAPQDRIIDAMKQMLDIGYLYQKEQKISFEQKIRALKPNWELMSRDGIWDPDKEIKAARRTYSDQEQGET